MALGLGVVAGLGGEDGDVVRVSDVANDRAGHVYVCGTFEGFVDFDVRRNRAYVLDTFRRRDGGGFERFGVDGFAAKYTADGRLIWARQVQLTGDGTARVGSIGRMAVEGDGEVVLTGSFDGTVDFNPLRGRYALTSETAGEAFAWKLDEGGRVVWAAGLGRLVEGGTGSVGRAVAVDAAGDAVVTGEAFPEGGEEDGVAFVSRLDGGTGEVAYGREVGLSTGGPLALVGNAVAADPEGHVYVTGGQVGGLAEGFVAKVNRRGNTVWARSLGDSLFGSGGGQGVAVTRRGGVFVVGSFSGNGLFANVPRLSNGTTDAYLALFDAEGDVDWVRHWGGQNGEAFADDVVIDAGGRAVVSGVFGQEVDFDTGGGRRIREAGDRRDFYVARFFADGVFSTVATFGGRQGKPTTLAGVSASRSGGVIFGASFDRVFDFDPGVGQAEVDAGLGENGVWVRLDEV
jgi:hypothetical protein